jgi:hypothetical protein
MFAPYLPILGRKSATGWMDIVCLASLVVLASALDRRGYADRIPPIEDVQRTQVLSMYRRWRRWFSVKYDGERMGAPVDWEKDVFSVRAFNHLT